MDWIEKMERKNGKGSKGKLVGKVVNDGSWARKGMESGFMGIGDRGSSIRLFAYIPMANLLHLQ